MLQTDLLDHVMIMRGATDVLELRRNTIAFVQSMGFRSVYFLTPIARDAREGRVLINAGFNPVWERAYRRCLYLIDPLPRVALNQSTPFFWRDLAKRDDLSDDGKRYLALLARHDMANGIAVPTFGPGSRCGMVGVGNHPALEMMEEEELARLQIGAQASYARYCDLVSAEIDGVDPLSNREMDVLYWITQGKSNSSIGKILGISSQTVDTYVRRIFAKLGVADRTGAAVEAMQRGIFVSGYYRAQPQME